MRNSSTLADKLGNLRATIADLQAEAKAIELKFKSEPPQDFAFEGDLFRVTVSHGERTTTNWKEVAAKLEPSHQLVTAHSKTVPTITLRVNARLKAVA